MSASNLVAILSNPVTLKHVVDTMKDLVKNVNMDCNDNGLQVQYTDTANVGLVHLMMTRQVFKSYRCTKPMTFGLNMELLSKVLKLCGNTDKLTLEAEPSTGKVTWIFESSDEGDPHT